MFEVARKISTGGFSYVELVFAVGILAVMAAVATPYLQKNIQRKQEAELRQDLRMIREAIDAYKAAYDAGKMGKTLGETGYPVSLNDLVRGVEDVTDPNKKKIRFLRRLPADPMFIQSQFGQSTMEIDPAETWGKRSYESEADAPREGSDIYDVYSTSQALGLNGVPYAKW